MAENEEVEKKLYRVRSNCEYSIDIEATSQEEAEREAGKIPYEDWDQAWAAYDTEEIARPEPISGPGGIGRTDMPYGQGGGLD